jgi:hypothetical protein
MKYELKKHEQDGDMVEATFQFNNMTCLAFVFHIDCLVDCLAGDDIRGELEERGTAEVELSLVKHN